MTEEAAHLRAEVQALRKSTAPERTTPATATTTTATATDNTTGADAALTAELAEARERGQFLQLEVDRLKKELQSSSWDIEEDRQPAASADDGKLQELQSLVSELKRQLSESEAKAAASESAAVAARARAADVSAELEGAAERSRAMEGQVYVLKERLEEALAAGAERAAEAARAKEAEVETIWLSKLKAQETDSRSRISELEALVQQLNETTAAVRASSAGTATNPRIQELEALLSKEREVTAAAIRDCEKAEQKRAELAADLNVANRKLMGATERIVLMTGKCWG